MTSFEQQQLAAIERQLTDESPDLVRTLADPGRVDPADRKRWGRDGMATVLVGLVLLVVGIVTGVAALAVSSLCPLLTYVLMAAGHRYARSRPTRSW